MTIDSLRVALRALLANRLRSALTMLGILMGTAAVILLVATGAGISNQVQGQIGKLGTNALYVLNERTTGGRDRGATNSRQIQLTPADVKALEDKTRAPSVARVTPGVSATGTLTWNGATYPLQSFLGVEPVLGGIRNLTVREGRWLTDEDQADHAKVAVVGTTVVDHVFGPGVDPVGRTVEFNDVEFKIVGLLQHRGSNGTGIGGLIGAAVGVGVGHLPIAGVHPHVSPGSVALSFGFSLLIGVFFGAYPASRAATLTPIVALRYE